MSGRNEFRFFFSCDINLPVTFRIDRLEGTLPPLESSDSEGRRGELYVECALFIDGAPFGLPMKTRFECGQSFCWNELITLSTKYRDLTAQAQLTLTVWDVSCGKDEGLIGGATTLLFNSKKQLRTGKQKLRLWQGKEADGSFPTATPGKVPRHERGELERLEKLMNKYERGQIQRVDWLDRLAIKGIEKIRERESISSKNSHLFILVDFCSLEHQVVFQESGANSFLPVPLGATNEFVTVWDPEVGKTNLSEHKQLKLARSLTRGIIDRDLKPSSNEKKSIQRIVKYPPTRTLNGDEKQLLWKFRYSLMSEKRALTKFLRCVEWSDIQEAKQTIDLMMRWEMIDVCDALELLSPVFHSEEVRAYAVSVLERADDEELQCYLLQLVQALRFERSDTSRLSHFLVQRSVRNIELASFLRWYVAVELHDPSHAKRFYSTYKMLEENMVKFSANENGGEDGSKLWQNLVLQKKLTASLCSIMSDVRNARGGTEKKTQKLRQLLSGLPNELDHFHEPIRSPLAPHVLITGIIPSECQTFKSALYPSRLTFRTADGESCRMIFKKGDDLRQDQLVIQMVSLMDRLLKLENLDLHLTPYRVLATGQDDGMLEFIPSRSLAQILSEHHRSIIGFLQKFHPDEDAPFGVTPTCLDTFIKSCAGYSVITYILGVGDRHLDNLLLREDGRLFHVDFSFILGRDPKPFPPPMKLCKEMAKAMGGAESPYYRRFKSYCCEAYNILRKSSNLNLNLFHLMAGSNIPDIASDPEKGILKVIVFSSNMESSLPPPSDHHPLHREMQEPEYPPSDHHPLHREMQEPDTPFPTGEFEHELSSSMGDAHEESEPPSPTGEVHEESSSMGHTHEEPEPPSSTGEVHGDSSSEGLSHQESEPPSQTGVDEASSLDIHEGPESPPPMGEIQQEEEEEEIHQEGEVEEEEVRQEEEEIQQEGEIQEGEIQEEEEIQQEGEIRETEEPSSDTGVPDTRSPRVSSPAHTTPSPPHITSWESFIERMIPLILVMAQLISACATIFNRLADEHKMDRRVLLAYQYLFGFFILGPAALYERQRWHLISRKVFFYAFLVAFFKGSFMADIYLRSIAEASTTIPSIIQACTSLITMFVGILAGSVKFSIHEYYHWLAILGGVIGVGGAIMVGTLKRVTLRLHIPTRHPPYQKVVSQQYNLKKGSEMAISSCLFIVSASFLQERMMKIYPAFITCTAMISFFGAVQAIIYGMIKVHHLNKWSLGFDIRLWASLYLGIFSNGLYNLIIAYCMEKKNPVYTAMFGPTTLMFTTIGGTIAGYFMFNDKLDFGSILGAPLVVLGVWLYIWAKDKGEPKENVGTPGSV